MTEPLIAAERAALRAALDALVAELNQRLVDSAARAATVHLDQSRMGRVSRGDALQRQQMAKAGRRRIQARLVRVEGAIERFDQDPAAYGICPRCDDDIGHARLSVFPEAPFCVPCTDERR